jgi:hypothetical protein
VRQVEHDDKESQNKAHEETAEKLAIHALTEDRLVQMHFDVSSVCRLSWLPAG